MVIHALTCYSQNLWEFNAWAISNRKFSFQHTRNWNAVWKEADKRLVSMRLVSSTRIYAFIDKNKTQTFKKCWTKFQRLITGCITGRIFVANILNFFTIILIIFIREKMIWRSADCFISYALLFSCVFLSCDASLLAVLNSFEKFKFGFNSLYCIPYGMQYTVSSVQQSKLVQSILIFECIRFEPWKW